MLKPVLSMVLSDCAHQWNMQTHFSLAENWSSMAHSRKIMWLWIGMQWTSSKLNDKSQVLCAERCELVSD